MIYLMSDLHGEYEAFVAMLNKIAFGSKDTLYILGDIIDRGQHPVELLQFVSRQDNMEFILGNHEDMFLSILKSNNVQDKFFYNQVGGKVTLSQFEGLRQSERNSLLNYLQTRELYKIVDGYILVHAGIVPLTGTPQEVMGAQNRENMLWIREDFIYRPALAGSIVVFGHTPTALLQGRGRIWHDSRYKDKICIDCGLALGDRLGCLRLDDMKEFYVEKN